MVSAAVLQSYFPSLSLLEVMLQCKPLSLFILSRDTESSPHTQGPSEPGTSIYKKGTGKAAGGEGKWAASVKGLGCRCANTARPRHRLGTRGPTAFIS